MVLLRSRQEGARAWGAGEGVGAGGRAPTVALTASHDALYTARRAWTPNQSKLLPCPPVISGTVRPPQLTSGLLAGSTFTLDAPAADVATAQAQSSSSAAAARAIATAVERAGAAVSVASS